MSQYQNRKTLAAFSQNLRVLRGGRSQADFAKLLGIRNQVTYHRYENGRVPKLQIIQQIAKRIGIGLEEMLQSLPKERVRQISVALNGSSSTADANAEALSPEDRTAISEMISELVSEESIGAIQKAFRLPSLDAEELVTLFEHIVSESNCAPLFLSKYYVLIRVALAKELEKRMKVRFRPQIVDGTPPDEEAK